ncbi:hypothetical protein Tco_1048137, partial [Tanacetum coccineum]
QKKVDEGEKDAQSYDDVDDFDNRLEPRSHKENPEYVDDDDDDDKEEEKDTLRSPRINLSSDKNIVQELKQRRISSKYSHLPGALHRMFRLQGYMIRDMERKFITTNEFWEVHGNVDQVLHEIVPQLAERAIEDLIENNLKPIVANTTIQERDAFHAETNVIQVHPTIITSIETSSSADLQQQLYLMMKRSLQDQVGDPALWEGEKRVKRHKTSKSSKSARGSSSKQLAKDSTIMYPSNNSNNRNGMHGKYVPTIFDRARMEATLNDMLSNKFKNDEEVYKQNQRRVRHNPEDYLSNHIITEVVRITTDQPHGLDFMEQIIMLRENDKPNSFSKADFKYLNKNDVEDLYYLCQNKKERVHDFQLGIKSYQIKVNLTVPTLTFPGIEAHEAYSIVDKPTTEKVLKEVKLMIFQSEPWKKEPLLGGLDHDIMRAFEREITKRLRNREQMRRWESFVNERPILPMMKHL